MRHRSYTLALFLLFAGQSTLIAQDCPPPAQRAVERALVFLDGMLYLTNPSQSRKIGSTQLGDPNDADEIQTQEQRIP